TEEVVRVRVRVGRDVERLVVADAGEGAGGDVTHRVAARLARGDAHGGQAAHQIRRVLDVDEVELDVLARRDVQDRVRVLLGEIRGHFDLLGRELPVGDLDAHHARRVPQG